MLKEERVEFLPSLLDGLNIYADIRQREAIRTTLSLSGSWSPERQAEVIAAILARNARQQETLKAELAAWLTPAIAPATTRIDLAMAQTSGTRRVDEEDETPRGETPSFLQALVASVRNKPGRVPWYAVPTAASVLLIILVSLYGEAISVKIPYISPDYRSDMRREVLWALSACAVLLPLGYCIERAFEALRHLRQQRNQTRLVRRRVLLKRGPGWFASDRVGEDKPLDWFSQKEALAIARVVPTRRGTVNSTQLNTSATVRETARAGRIPTLIFDRRRTVAPILVLGDRESGARGWSDLPAALYHALARAGIHVTLGYFDGRVERFEIRDGTSLNFGDLLRRPELLMLVSDGTRIGDTETARALLRRLGASRNAAWIDERESRYWHSRDPQVGIRGLPIFPGTADGIITALRCLGGERIAPPAAGSITAPPAGAFAAAHIATLLTDAVGWAAACAMLQPISAPLAQRLRAIFFPHLPPIAFGRLLKLEGSELTQAGLRFSTPVLATLRADFALRFDALRREEILNTISDAIRRSNPEQPGSPAQDAFDWYNARFLLDYDPDTAASKLLRLRGTALGPAIAQELQQVRLPHVPMEGDAVAVPLLRKPRDTRALLEVAQAFEAPLAGEPVEPWLLLWRNDVVSCPEPGLAVGEAMGKLVVLLESGDLFEPERGIIALSSAATSSSASSIEAIPVVAVPSKRTLVAIANRSRGGIEVFPLLAASTTREAGRVEPVCAWSGENVSSLAWSSDESLLVGVVSSGLVVLNQEAGRGWEQPRILSGDMRGATAVAFAKDSDLILIGVGGRVLRLQRRLLLEPIRDSESKSGVAGAPGAESILDPLSTGLSIIEAIAAGSSADGFPIAAAGGGLVVVLQPDGTRRGPWILPDGTATALNLLEEGRIVGVLTGGQLSILHALSGLNLLEEGQLRGALHAALAVDSGQAFLWSENRRAITLHGFQQGLTVERGEAA